MLDFPRGTKITGSGFAHLQRHQAPILERALINFMLDMHSAREHGYTEILHALRRQSRVHDSAPASFPSSRKTFTTATPTTCS